jgi:hypothetical protein
VAARVPHSIVFVLGGCAVAAIAACSGGGMGARPVPFAATTLRSYARHSSQVSRTVSISLPQYIAAAKDGTLYVPDQTNVEIYAPGSGTPEGSIQNSLVLPEGVAIH